MDDEKTPAARVDAMSDRDIVRRALHDAVSWRESLADAWAEGTPERAHALALAERFRRLLQRRYGESRSPAECLLDEAETVPVPGLGKV